MRPMRPRPGGGRRPTASARAPRNGGRSRPNNGAIQAGTGSRPCSTSGRVAEAREVASGLTPLAAQDAHLAQAGAAAARGHRRWTHRSGSSKRACAPSPTTSMPGFVWPEALPASSATTGAGAVAGDHPARPVSATTPVVGPCSNLRSLIKNQNELVSRYRRLLSDVTLSPTASCANLGLELAAADGVPLR